MPTITRDHCQLHYRSVGQGEAILMLQGVGLPSAGWLPQSRFFADSYQVISPDNRGIGLSEVTSELLTIEQMAADALAILDAEGIEQAHVVGHSMGGILAQQVALDAPSRVKSLSLLSTTGQAKNAGKVTLSKIWLGIRAYVGTRPMRRRAFMEMVLTPKERADTDPAIMAKMLEEFFGRDLADQPAIVMRQVKALQMHDVLDRLGTLQHLPTLVISGALDTVVPAVEGRALAAAIGGTYEEWEDAAHGLTVTMKTQVNQRLLQHFQAVERL